MLTESEENFDKIVMIMKFLILDISPCLKKGLLLIINEFLKTTRKNIEKILLKLEKEGFINILYYTYYHSCIDLKRNIIDLLKNICSIENFKSKNLKNNENFYLESILSFLRENLLNFQSDQNNITEINPIGQELISEKIIQQVEKEFENIKNKKKENIIHIENFEKELNKKSFDRDLKNSINEIKDVFKEPVEQISIQNEINCN